MCGVFGVVSFNGTNVTPLVLESLACLQNRGRDSVGFAIGSTSECSVPIRFWKEPGSADSWFTRERANELFSRYPGDVGIGHVRYATASQRDRRNAQPHYFDSGGNLIILVSNGDIPFCKEVRKKLAKKFPFASRCDAEVVAKLLGQAWIKNGSEEEAFIEVGKTLSGAFSLTAITPSKRLFVMRDPLGFHPLWWTKNDEVFFVCSESALLERIGPVYEVERGTLVTVSTSGAINFLPFGKALPRFCLLEAYYFARPDSRLNGEITFFKARQELGRMIAREWRRKGYPLPDLVAPVLYSGSPAGQGCAIELGIPYIEAIFKDRFGGRVFQEDEVDRKLRLASKFSVFAEEVEGKKVMVIDDSIVRGDQSRLVVHLMREAGAKEIYYCSTAPPFRGPCFFGINIPDPNRLIAHHRTEEEVRQEIGADILHYLSLPGTFEVLGSNNFCTGCFNGQYPLPVPERGEEV